LRVEARAANYSPTEPGALLPHASAVAEAVAFLRERITRSPRAVLVLGSGLGGVGGEIADPVRVPYGDIPAFPRATVPGHAGALLAGTWEGVEVIVMQGRFHLYEGWDAVGLALPLRVLAALGADTLIVTNAAGGIHPGLAPGQLMLMVDHLNLAFRNPLIGPAAPGEERFPDMSSPYDPQLAALARLTAEELGISLIPGIYAAVLGPSYETRAEVRMLGLLGADAVGMSTAPEVIVARALGMRVLGISCVTNLAAGLGGAVLTHAEVIEVAGEAGIRLAALLRTLLPRALSANPPPEAPS
jgi:purine-nucleoside phosphorylase